MVVAARSFRRGVGSAMLPTPIIANHKRYAMKDDIDYTKKYPLAEQPLKTRVFGCLVSIMPFLCLLLGFLLPEIRHVLRQLFGW